MNYRHRTPSPTREAYLRLNRRPSGEPTRYVPTQRSTYAGNQSVTLGSNHFDLGWHGLPSPETPGIFNELDHRISISVYDDQINGVSSAETGHHLQPLKVGIGHQTSSQSDSDSVTQSTKTLEGEVHPDKLLLKLPEDFSSHQAITTRESSPLSSLGSGEYRSLPSSPIQSQRIQQSLMRVDELSTSIITASDESVPGPGQDLQAVDQDAKLARAIDAMINPGPLRRSGRIKRTTKSEETPQSRATATRHNADKTPSAQAEPQCESSIVTFKPDPIHFYGLPALHSVDWNLQYPAGGSTHPCYPYPNLDPRLIFHEGFVPQSDGLPNISRVPKLLLPLGWKHVTWSGLLPVAFDPYQQAFKLTPVGPLPLTSEELQQNGLYRYVPGGELHPETPHLPKMVEFSDGSDETVYNWEVVDWTLPWTEMNESLDLFKALPSRSVTDGSVAHILGQGQLSTSNTAVSHYTESWDCPDGIVDLVDAWRWLQEKELKPTPTFVPTVGKSWRGTGIYRVNRKVKQPVAGLMALTIANSTDNPELYLVNQDTREFCPFRSVATPVHANISLLGEVEFTLQELLSYFPNHFFWRKAADRLCYAGLSGGDVANMINMTRCLSDDAARRSGTVGEKLRYEIDGEGRRIKIERSEDIESLGYTAQGWSYDAWEMTDYPLLALAHGLLSLPGGEDAGPLTKLIIWCRQEGRYEVLLSHVPALMAEAGIEKTIERVAEGDIDKRMLNRHMNSLREDRKRVLEGEKKRKRMAEAKDQERRKKKKAA